MRKKWTKEEEDLLINNLKMYKSIAKLPLKSLSDKLGRTADSITRKAKRLQDEIRSQYVWDREESGEAFLLYLKGEALSKILSELHEQGSTCTLEQLEKELQSRRKKAEEVIRSYAEERQLKLAKRLSLDTILLFLNNYNTTSDFTRKALHARIAHG